MRKKTYTKNVGVLLTEQTYQQLFQVTNQKEISFSEFIRVPITEGLIKINKEE